MSNFFDIDLTIQPRLTFPTPYAEGPVPTKLPTKLHEQLIAAVRNAAAGKRVVSNEIQSHLDAYPPKPVLSPRQIEVLAHAAKGMTTKEISDIMGIGADGVNAHLRVIFSRLGAASRTEAVSIALQNHLLKI